MNRYFLRNDHSIQHCISGDENILELNTPAGAIYVDSEVTVELTSYWDSYLSMFMSIGKAPTSNHVFDYAIKQWVDPRTLNEIKAQKWDEIKYERDQLEFGGFEFEGGVYDSDRVSQGRIMGAASAGIAQVWTLADNTTVKLSAAELQQLYASLQAHIASVHERGRIARQLIFEAETKEEVEAIQL